MTREFLEALGRLVDAYGKYLEENSGDKTQLDVNNDLGNIMQKLLKHLEEDCVFTDESKK